MENSPGIRLPMFKPLRGSDQGSAPIEIGSVQRSDRLGRRISVLKLNYDPFKIAEAHLELWNNRNPELLRALLTPNATRRFVFEKEEKPVLKGIEEFDRIFRVPFPDLKLVHTNIIPTEGTLTIEWLATATHKAPFMEIPATGRIGTVPGTSIFKINEDGKIHKETVYLNLVDLLKVIGMVPLPLEEPKLREKALELLEAFNRHDIAKIQTFFLPTTKLIINGVEELHPAVKLLQNVSALPDLKWTIDHLAVRGNQVTAEVTAIGTLQAPLGPIPATGRLTKWNVAVILTFKEEKVEEFKAYIDEYSLLVQAGAIRELIVK